MTYFKKEDCHQCISSFIENQLYRDNNNGISNGNTNTDEDKEIR